MREGSIEAAFSWTPNAAPSEKLTAVSIFDSHCAPVYLRDKTDVAFRPFGLDVFDKLSAVCAQVRAALEKERTMLASGGTALPVLPEGTTARKITDTLTSLTSADHVRAVATFSDEEEQRLFELKNLRRDFEADDPRKRGRDLTLRAERLEYLALHLENCYVRLSDTALATLSALRMAAHDAHARLAEERASVATPDLLLGTGGPEWKAHWAAAEKYAAVAYPGRGFPHTRDGARCLLCQQPLGPEAADRMVRLSAFVLSRAQRAADDAEFHFQEASQKVDAEAAPSSLTVAREDLEQEDAAAAALVEASLTTASQIRNATIEWLKHGGDIPAGMEKPSTEILHRIAAGLRSRAKQLQASPAGMSAQMQEELKELEARQKLRDNLAVVLDAIERKKRMAAYGAALEDVTTNAITKKSTELTKELVTDTLRHRFAAELQRIGFTHLDVELQASGGSKGALFHKLVFTHAPSVPVSDVLSEGEARALSVAAFMTELSTASVASAIVFDDPVSSLDHVWRERIARRLAAEAEVRQTVVFTHDVLFLHFLTNEAEKQGVEILHQCIRREAQAGICAPDLPWTAMRIKERIGVLKARLQRLEKTYQNEPDRYESEARETYGFLREAWEQAVGEVLLNDVIGRYRPSIETNRALKLHDISKDDCEALEEGMSKCSRWIRGHDSPPADGTPVPHPSEVADDIARLEVWVTSIRKRR